MRQVQHVGLLFVVGFLEVVMLGLLGCGGTSGDGNSAARVSRIALQVTTEEQAGGNTLRNAAEPGQARVVPTDPNDLAFVSRLDIEVSGPGIPTPVQRSVRLTADQQTGATVDLDVPSGSNRRIAVNAFHVDPSSAAEIRIFEGETTADLLTETATVSITLRRVLLPETVTAAALANSAFTFENGAAFGVPPAVTLSFGDFSSADTGPYTLASNGFVAVGTMTVIPPATATTLQNTALPGQPRQASSTSCSFAVSASNYPSGGGPQASQTLLMSPCETDAIEGNLILVNAATGARSTSRPPTAAPRGLPPNTVRIGSPAGPVTAGGTFTVPVEFNADGTQVISYLFELTFDSTVVAVLNIEGLGPFTNVVTNPLAFAAGSVRFASNNTAFTPASGLLNLANITFQVIGSAGGVSPLVLRFPPALGGTGVIVDETFAAIEGVTFVDGTVQVQ